jgi:phosphopantetheine adenylyltransferase
VNDRRAPPRRRRAVCPGSFDPVTLRAHRHPSAAASKLYDEVVRSRSLVNKEQGEPWFSVDERMDMLTEVTAV